MSANRAIVPQVRVRFEKRLILDPFPVPSPVLPGVCEPGSACSICVGCTPSTFEAAKGTPERVHCTVLRTRNSLDLCMVNLMEDSEEHELGPWHLSLEVPGGSSFEHFYIDAFSYLFCRGRLL